ncbi:hypothetical protein [Absidia glauca]|uniref:Brl1/Brr6 domain-containing protein n=1 Tax=Absidia glauca TaxID=4829 RepID=A0A163LZX7_ABSGL|nr:hypothetical protein [Absidia glauca]
MDFEYQYSNLDPGNSLPRGKHDSSPTLDKAALEAHSLFLPKAYFNTGVDSALDQTISTQLGGISLVDSTTTEGTPSLEKDVCDQNCDQKGKSGNDGVTHTFLVLELQTGDNSDEQNTTTAVVPYHRPLPTSPLSISPDHNVLGDINNQHTSSPFDNKPSLLGEDESGEHTPTMDRSESMMNPQQRYEHHLYPTASFYHHDPIAHRTSLVNYFAGLIQIGCQLLLFFFCLYIGYQFILALNEDVALKIQVYESEYMDKHFICEQEYHRNHCHNNNRPAMIEPCRQWLQCLYTPAWIGKTKVLAETFAEIANGFVDTISYKTMAFGSLVIITTIWFSSQGRQYQQQQQHQGRILPES